MEQSTATKTDVLITRIFNASRELVFQAWTDPKHLVNWYAPTGCSISFTSIDVREGGSFHSCIRTPGMHDCWCKGEYLEVKSPERLVFSLIIADENGNVSTADEMGMDHEWPQQTIVTVTFEDIQGKTKLTLHQTVDETLAKKTGAYPGWLSQLDNLATELESMS